MGKFKKTLIVSIIFIIGVLSLYLIASQFLGKTPSSEITFGSEEEVTEEEMSKIKRIDYLAPDFKLLNIEGEEIKLSDYQNKIIVLAFWTTWNPATQDELVILESYYQEIKDKEDIVLLTVNNLEDKSVVSNFIRRGKYVLPVLLDKDGEVGELYGISILPATFFINQEGKVKEMYVGVLNKEEVENKVEKLYLK